MPSERQLDANRRNAQKSTGPKTPEGRAAVRLNALRHGLTAQNAVIEGEQEKDFQEVLEAFEAEYQPVGPTENLLLQQIVMASWRLQRIRGIETAIFDLRQIDLSDKIQNEYDDLDTIGRQAFVFLNDCRGANALANLARYEARIERSFYKALHELQRLQALRPPAAPPDTGQNNLPASDSKPAGIPLSESKKQTQSQERTPGPGELGQAASPDKSCNASKKRINSVPPIPNPPDATEFDLLFLNPISWIFLGRGAAVISSRVSGSEELRTPGRKGPVRFRRNRRGQLWPAAVGGHG